MVVNNINKFSKYMVSRTSDPGHFRPKTLRHQCRTVRTYRH